MKRLLLLALLIALLALPALQAQAQVQQNWQPIAIDKWGGLDLLHDSTQISPTDAQVARNVLTDNGYLEKRPGNVILTTILAGYPVKYVNDWVSPNGTRYLISHASSTVYQTDFSGSPVALSTTGPTANISVLPAFARLFIADGVRAPWYWDGTSTATVVNANGLAAPICTYLAYKDSRIFCANIPNEGTSRVRISSTGGAGYWVVPPDVATVDNTPNVFDFTPDDGDHINCLATTPWGVFVGKQYSSSMIKGTGNISYDLRILDPKVGCKDNRSVQMVYGVLQWLSNDGVYAYDGSGPPRLISRELDPLIGKLQSTSYGSKEWRVDIKDEWTAGNLTASGSGAPMSATLLPGSIIPSSTTFIDLSSTTFLTGTMLNVGTNTATTVAINLRTNFIRDGDFSLSTSAWFIQAPASGLVYIGKDASFDSSYSSVAVMSGQSCTQFGIYFSSISHSATSGPIDLYSRGCVINGPTSFGSAGAPLHYVCDMAPTIVDPLAPSQVSTTTWFHIGFCSGGANMQTDNCTALFSSTGTSTGRYVEFDVLGNCAFGPTSSAVFDNIKVSSYAPSGSYTSRTFDTTVSTPTFSLFDPAEVSSSATSGVTYQEQTSVDGVTWSAAVSLARFAQPTQKRRYWRYIENFTNSYSSITAGYSGGITEVAATTGSYNSDVHFIGSAITAYGSLVVSQTTPFGSTVTYTVRAATYAFTNTATSPAFSAQVPNTTIGIAVSTPVYFQFRSVLDFDQPVNSPTISRVVTNWQEGTGQPVSSGVRDRRYHLCLTVSTVAVRPDTCLIYQKNQKWVTWTGPSIGAMGQYNYNLVAADGNTSSKIWSIMQDGVYNDDGVAIDADWRSPDFTLGLIFNKKVLHEMWVDVLPVVASSMTLSYTVNKASSSVASQFYLDNGKPANPSLSFFGGQYGFLNKLVPLRAGYTTGKYFNFDFSDNTLNSYFRANSYLLYFEDQGRSIP